MDEARKGEMERGRDGKREKMEKEMHGWRVWGREAWMVELFKIEIKV